MAPIPRYAITDGHSGFANGVSTPFDAPPSTMAAALINNLRTGNQQRGPVEDDLKRLVREVSEMESSLAQTHDPIAKLEYKHKIIYLFSRTVLERLDGNASDSFDPVDVPMFLVHASDTLDLFMTTIKEFPAVLDYTLPQGTYFQSRGQEPLWIWLFPRILTLLGRETSGSLTDKIKDFFFVAFQVVSRSPKLWNLNSFFFSYLKECVASTYIRLAFLRTAVDTFDRYLAPHWASQYHIFQGGRNQFTNWAG